MKTEKSRNNFLLKCFAVTLVLFIVSCSKDSYESLTSDSSALSKKVLADPLFENLDKAFYAYKINAIKYGGTDSVDPELAENLKSDITNRKIKSQADLVKLKEAIGYKDYEARTKVKFNYATAKLALMKKYPELNQNKEEFNLFLAKNTKYQITLDTLRKLLTENKNARKYVEN